MSFRLYQFPNIFKSIATQEQEAKLLSDKGLRRIKELQTYSIPDDLLYKIDKIVREKLKEESIRFTKLDSNSLIKEEENENTSTDYQLEGFPLLQETPIVQHNDDIFVTPPTRVSAVPWFRSTSADGYWKASRALNYESTWSINYDDWKLWKETELRLKEKLISKVKDDILKDFIKLKELELVKKH